MFIRPDSAICRADSVGGRLEKAHIKNTANGNGFSDEAQRMDTRYFLSIRLVDRKKAVQITEDANKKLPHRRDARRGKRQHWNTATDHCTQEHHMCDKPKIRVFMLEGQ